MLIKTLKEQLEELAIKCAKTYLCEVVDLKFISRIGKIKIYIEKDNHAPMDINTCAFINQEFCKLLDIHFPHLRVKYDVDVASVGIDRVLNLTDLQSHIGARVAIIDKSQNYDIYYICSTAENAVAVVRESILENKIDKKKKGKFIDKVKKMLDDLDKEELCFANIEKVRLMHRFD